MKNKLTNKVLAGIGILAMVLGLTFTPNTPVYAVNDKQIFLDGVQGQDGNDGLTAGQALKTFAKARELAEQDQTIKEIVVLGTVDVEGEITLEGTAAKLIRGESFSKNVNHALFMDNIFRVAPGKALTLKNITIDGNGKVVKAETSLIQVEAGATLNITEGTILENNVLYYERDSKEERTYGGAVNAVSANVNMSGGIIRNNVAISGGGICLTESTMNFTAGIIEDNTAKPYTDTDVNQHYGSGGGIRIHNGSALTIEEGIIIRNNSAGEAGGGISVGDEDWGKQNVFTMNGGLIEGNKAGAAGGGVFLQAGLVGNKGSIGTIKAGKIINNKMTDKGKSNSAFGGGGIYVNGMPEVWHIQGQTLEGDNARLYLTNALITDNTARVEGGGLASCPISNTEIFAENTAAIYGNKNVYKNRGQDVFIYSNLHFGAHSGKARLKISNRMLGGRLYNWEKREGTPGNTVWQPCDATALPSELPDLESIHLNATNSYEEAEINQFAKVFITGNASETRGGGIGSNGTIIIGTEGKNDLRVNKTWAEGTTPEEITVELRGHIDNNDADWLVEQVKLNEANQFTHIFKDLPTNLHTTAFENLFYLKEIESDKFQSTVEPIKEVVQAPYLLTFGLDRPGFQPGLGTVNSICFNYYLDHPETNIVDEEEGELNDFDVKINLYGTDKKLLAEKKMTYRRESHNWNGRVDFADIPVDSEQITIEYYKNDDGQMIEPHLFEYNLYLEKQGDQVLLKIPAIAPNPEVVKNPTGDEGIATVEDLAVDARAGNKEFVINIENSPLTNPPGPNPPGPNPPVVPFEPIKPFLPNIPDEPSTPPAVEKMEPKLPKTGATDHFKLTVGIMVTAIIGLGVISKKRWQA